MDIIEGFLFIMIGIYKITSPSKRVYIGQSMDIERRWDEYKRLDCKKQPRLYNSFKKYGVENHKFEVICLCIFEDLNEMERYYQDAYCSINKHGLNCLLTKTNDRKMEVSDDTKKKISNANKNPSDEKRKNLSLSHIGKTASKETVLKMSIAKKGKKKSIETRTKMSIASKLRMTDEWKKQIGDLNRNPSEETRYKIGLAHKGKIVSDITRAKMSASKKGKKLSEEHKAKVSASLKGRIVSSETRNKISIANKKYCN